MARRPQFHESQVPARGLTIPEPEVEAQLYNTFLQMRDLLEEYAPCWYSDLLREGADTIARDNGASSANNDSGTNPGTILLVEDNPGVQMLVRMVLETAGYTVITAADGVEGLSVYAQHHANIGLLLTDVTMPNMNGLELADRVLQLDSQLPILFMSGDVQNVDRGLGCIAKPFKPVELVARVREAFAAQNGARIPANVAPSSFTHAARPLI